MEEMPLQVHAHQDANRPHGRCVAPEPAVVCVAPNGARRTKHDHPRLPMSAAELAREAYLCLESGATVIHLHVRDAQGAHSLDVDQYREAIAQVRHTVGDRMLIQVTTEAVGRYWPAQQMEVVKALRPEAASVAIRELIPDESHLAPASRFFEWSAANGVALQFIVYSADEAARLVELARRGALGVDRPNTLFVLGRYSVNQQSAPTDLLPFLADWPHDFPWSVCAFGSTEAQCIAAAIGLGGHARVGFENNLLQANGQPAECNADLVANVADLIRGTGRRIANIDEARAVYGAVR